MPRRRDCCRCCRWVVTTVVVVICRSISSEFVHSWRSPVLHSCVGCSSQSLSSSVSVRYLAYLDCRDGGILHPSSCSGTSSAAAIAEPIGHHRAIAISSIPIHSLSSSTTTPRSTSSRPTMPLSRAGRQIPMRTRPSFQRVVSRLPSVA